MAVNLQTIPFVNAVLCEQCKVVSNAQGEVCPVCAGVGGLASLQRIVEAKPDKYSGTSIEDLIVMVDREIAESKKRHDPLNHYTSRYGYHSERSLGIVE
jgi:tRNA(Arg) A34 adenosine deaminase TadA